jgi:hypothetical protein
MCGGGSGPWPRPKRTGGHILAQALRARRLAAVHCSGSGKVKTYAGGSRPRGATRGRPALARGGTARYGNGAANGGCRHRSRRSAVAACFLLSAGGAEWARSLWETAHSGNWQFRKWVPTRQTDARLVDTRGWLELALIASARGAAPRLCADLASARGGTLDGDRTTADACTRAQLWDEIWDELRAVDRDERNEPEP